MNFLKSLFTALIFTAILCGFTACDKANADNSHATAEKNAAKDDKAIPATDANSKKDAQIPDAGAKKDNTVNNAKDSRDNAANDKKNDENAKLSEAGFKAIQKTGILDVKDTALMEEGTVTVGSQKCVSFAYGKNTPESFVRELRFAYCPDNKLYDYDIVRDSYSLHKSK